VVRQLRVIAEALRDAGVPVLGATQVPEEEPVA
jgi:hypothetical protein